MEHNEFWRALDPLPSMEEMAAFDDATISGRKVVDPQTGELLVGACAAGVLMERAGRTVFDEVFRIYRPDHIIVFCGSGNNGGDGLVLARQAVLSDITVQAFLVLAGSLSPLVLQQAQKFVAAGGSLFAVVEGSDEAKKFIKLGEPAKSGGDEITIACCSLPEVREHLRDNRAVVVDALLGFKQSDALREPIKGVCCLLQTMRPLGKRVVALDVPTGTDSNSGCVAEGAVQSEFTITLEFIKRGILQYPARRYAGNLVRVPIGIKASGYTEFSLVDESCYTLLQDRPGDLHKGGAGHLLVVGGSRRMPGAPILAGYAGLRAGVGIATLAVPNGALQQGIIPELMLLPGGGGDHFVVADAEVLTRDLKRYSGITLGPGIGQSPGAARFVIELLDAIRSIDIPVVIDADAINILALEGPRQLPPRTVITPHPGEAGRLLGVSSAEIQADRYEATKRLYDLTGAVVVLKGAGSIVWSGTRGLVNSSGNPWMATAGSGDVLAGVVGAFLAQGQTVLEAALLGTFFHGKAGDRAHSLHGGPLIASDISESLPYVLGEGFRARNRV